VCKGNTCSLQKRQDSEGRQPPDEVFPHSTTINKVPSDDSVVIINVPLLMYTRTNVQPIALNTYKTPLYLKLIGNKAKANGPDRPDYYNFEWKPLSLLSHSGGRSLVCTPTVHITVQFNSIQLPRKATNPEVIRVLQASAAMKRAKSSQKQEIC
jgi:hypothetical protein